ncbi:NERD domain-containing protein [Ornithinibacillus californiensis]|uniref:NERD domain-containing protein n=1 Tax=Ornithinibacillus californiensis TaxID=161536 RepID=UPI00064D94BF|nr:NERD domain-containing protein [Ornithinibacillus californiensis]
MVFIYILIILFLVLFFINYNYATIKGRFGENRVNKLLRKLDENEYKIYHDLYVPTEENKTTQVDHVVVSSYGIFVIETKAYNGWIFGNEKSKYWTQVIYKRKEKLFNPIWQNAGHTKALENYLGIEKKLFTSIIAFSNQSTFKFKEKFTRAKVIHFRDLYKTIKEKNAIIIDNSLINNLHSKLNKLVVVDKKEKKQISKKHVQEVKLEIAKSKTTNLDKLKCPKCNSDLVKRKGKYGEFLGCSSYPKCRYIGKL